MKINILEKIINRYSRSGLDNILLAKELFKQSPTIEVLLRRLRLYFIVDKVADTPPVFQDYILLVDNPRVSEYNARNTGLREYHFFHSIWIPRTEFYTEEQIIAGKRRYINAGPREFMLLSGKVSLMITDKDKLEEYRKKHLSTYIIQPVSR